MNKDLYFNYSGGADGADSEWDKIGREYGFNNHFHFYHGKKTPLGNIELTDEELEEGWEHILKANETLKRYHIEKYKSLLGRNWFQIKDTEIVLAISTFKTIRCRNENSNKQFSLEVNGGTSWAVQMAIDSKVPYVFVFDQDEDDGWHHWKIWNYILDDWQVFDETPTLLEHYTGIGTRKINQYGLSAIRNVFEETINNKT